MENLRACIVAEPSPDFHSMLVADPDSVMRAEVAGHAGDTGRKERLPSVPDCTRGPGVEPELPLDWDAQNPAFLPPDVTVKVSVHSVLSSQHFLE